MKVLDYADLKAVGIKYSRAHLHRLITAGDFPAPIKLSVRRKVWLPDAIDAYLARKIEESARSVERD